MQSDRSCKKIYVTDGVLIKQSQDTIQRSSKIVIRMHFKILLENSNLRASDHYDHLRPYYSLLKFFNLTDIFSCFTFEIGLIFMLMVLFFYVFLRGM